MHACALMRANAHMCVAILTQASNGVGFLHLSAFGMCLLSVVGVPGAMRPYRHSAGLFADLSGEVRSRPLAQDDSS